MAQSIGVLVVDDSALVRRTVARLLEEDRGIRVVGWAGNGVEALERVKELKPDVVTLDISMPVMDGITCLGELVRTHRQRVIIVSTLAKEDSFTTFKALALGAIDFVTKPGEASYLQTLEELGSELRKKVRVAACVPIEKIGRKTTPAPRSLSEKTEKAEKNEKTREPEKGDQSRARAGLFDNIPLRIAGVGGSTGGATALEMILKTLPSSVPLAIVAVQHLPAGFSKNFARYLDSVGPFRVHEALEGERVQPGHVYLAPHGNHLRVQMALNVAVLRLDPVSPPQGGYKPSINLLFYSLAAAEKHHAVGVLLSGMGEDGVGGLTAIHRLGGRTLVQDEATSVVFGMAAKAVSEGAVDEVLPLGNIGSELWRSSHRVFSSPFLARERAS